MSVSAAKTPYAVANCGLVTCVESENHLDAAVLALDQYLIEHEGWIDFEQLAPVMTVNERGCDKRRLVPLLDVIRRADFGFAMLPDAVRGYPICIVRDGHRPDYSTLPPIAVRRPGSLLI